MEADRGPADTAGASGELANGSGGGTGPGDKADGDLRARGAPVGSGVRGSGERNIAIEYRGDDARERSPEIRRQWWAVAIAGFRRAVRLGDAEGKDITVTVQPIHLRTGTGRRVIVLDPMGMDDLRAAIVSARILALALGFLVLALAAYITRLRQREERGE